MKINRKKLINILLCTSILLACIIFDLISKQFIFEIDKEIIPGVLKFYYTQNTGAAWSIFSNNTIALIIISAVAIVLLSFYVVFSKTSNKLFYVSLALIIGGAFGNFIDRIGLGYVRDFIKLEFINFPIFNIADCFLTIGVVLLFVYFLIEAIKEIKKNKGKKNGV